MDTVLTPILDALRVSLATQLAGTLGGPPSCGCVIVSGLEAAADRCGSGWVRLDRLYPSGQAFPGQDSSTKTSCVSVLAADIEVGVYRCVPTLTDLGEPPTPAEVTQAALVAADDALALAAAIRCCEPVTVRPNLMRAYTARGTGGCVGGAWIVTVQLRRQV